MLPSVAVTLSVTDCPYVTETLGSRFFVNVIGTLTLPSANAAADSEKTITMASAMLIMIRRYFFFHNDPP